MDFDLQCYTVRLVLLSHKNEHDFLILNLELLFIHVLHIYKMNLLRWCSSNRYITVLIELATIEGTSHGEALAAQLLDVTIRVPSVRTFAVAQLSLLLANAHALTPATSPTASALASPRNQSGSNNAQWRKDDVANAREATELLPPTAAAAATFRCQCACVLEAAHEHHCWHRACSLRRRLHLLRVLKVRIFASFFSLHASASRRLSSH